MRTVRWVVGTLAGLAVLYFLSKFVSALPGKIQPHVAFGSILVPWGWLWPVGGVVSLILLVLLYAFVYAAFSYRRSRRRLRPWAIFGQGLTHLLLWIFILMVYYPIIQVLAASFNPNNNLFSFKPVASSFLLLKAKVLPDLTQFSWVNYVKLAHGVIIYPWQALLMALAGLSLVAILSIAVYRRVGGGSQRLDLWQGRMLAAFLVSVAILLVFLSPSQFTGGSTESNFFLWVRNSLLIATLTGLLSVVLTATAGYAFARFHFSGRYAMLLIFIFVQMFPGFLALIALYYLMNSLGLLNTFTGLVLAYSGGIISFGSWVYKGYIESLSPVLEEAALIDGATRWQAFVRIVLPLSTPIFVFIFLLQFLGAYSEFILASIVLTGAHSWNVGVGLYNFTTSAFNIRWGVFAAGAVLGSLPAVAIFYGFQQYFVSGYTAGAVKE